MQHNTASYLLIVHGDHHYLHIKKSLRITIAVSETVNRWTANIQIEGKITKKQTMTYLNLQRIIEIEQHEYH